MIPRWLVRFVSAFLSFVMGISIANMIFCILDGEGLDVYLSYLGILVITGATLHNFRKGKRRKRQ